MRTIGIPQEQDVKHPYPIGTVLVRRHKGIFGHVIRDRVSTSVDPNYLFVVVDNAVNIAGNFVIVENVNGVKHTSKMNNFHIGTHNETDLFNCGFDSVRKYEEELKINKYEI